MPKKKLQVRLNEAIDRLIANAKRPGRRIKNSEPVCFYCGQPFDSAGHRKDIDHVTPLKLGGVDEGFNKVEVCSHCNFTKNGRHPVYWLMLQEMDLSDEQLLNWLARVLYHYLVTTPTGEKAWAIINEE